MQLTTQEIRTDIINAMVAGGAERRDAEKMLDLYRRRIVDFTIRRVKVRIHEAVAQIVDGSVRV